MGEEVKGGGVRSSRRRGELRGRSEQLYEVRGAERSMWRWSWWQRRVKRCWPAAVVVATCIGLLASRLSHAGSKRKSAYSRPTPPSPTTFDLPTLDPGLSTWVVLDAGGATGARVCESVYSRFHPHWTILIYGTDRPDTNSVSRCRYVPADVSRGPVDPRTAAPRLGADQRAFLFAVKSGAQAIYVPREVKALSSRESRPRVFTSSSYHGLIYNSSTATFNGIHHFGCGRTETQAERGQGRYDFLPHPDAPPPTYRFCQHLEPPALQVMAWLPVKPFDVRQEGSGRISSLDPCDRRAPPVTLDINTLGEIHLRGALYSESVFWALGMPMADANLSPAHRLAVGYALQRLVMTSGKYVQVRYGGIAGQGNVHSGQNVSGAFLYTVRQAVTRWVCSKPEIMACVRDLFHHLEELRLLERHLLASLYSWLDGLEEAGYKGPHLEGPSRATLGTCKQDLVVYHPVLLQGGIPWRRYRAKPHIPLRHEQLINKTVSHTCSGFSIKTHPLNPVNLAYSWAQMDNLVLLVVFNNPLYGVIPYIEALYRPFFPYMVYCGPGLPDYKTFPQLQGYEITFLSYGGTPEGHFPGSFSYECVAMASRMHLETAGYLIMADDMFVSVSRLSEFSVLQPWFVPKQEVRIGKVSDLRECRLGMCDFHTLWRWWEDYQKQILSVLSHIKSHQRSSRLLYRCHNQLVAVTGGGGRALGAYSDIFFIPEEYASDFAELTDIFLYHQVFVEVAVPTMLYCLELPERIVGMKGLPGFDVSRHHPEEHFNKKEFTGRTYLHPTKWSGLYSGNKTLAKFYCTKLLPHVHDPYGRLTE